MQRHERKPFLDSLGVTLARSLLIALLGAPMAVPAAPSSRIVGTELTAMRQVPVGETISLSLVPTGFDSVRQVQFKRIDVYAPDAKVLVMEAEGPREIPRSDWRFFIADNSVVNAPRMSLALSANGASAQGTLLSDDGNVYAISSVQDADGLRLTTRLADRTAAGEPTSWSCGDSLTDELSDHPARRPAGSTSAPSAPEGSPASRFAVVAFDTDNEFMNLKFSNNATNASNYIAAVIANFNVIYERDLDVTLTLGTVVLRPSTTADPYSATPDPGDGSARDAQLQEFTNFWNANQGSVQRAFAMMLSGKQPTANSSSGIAWVPFPLAGTNYCNSNHYSFTQVFKFSGSNASHDTYVLAHELGHNFGASHTHCSNATTGVPSSSGTRIDECFVQGGSCYSGPTSCPSPSTVNGVTNVRGTLMSYCHVLAGCSASNVFANAHRTYLLPTVQTNVTLGCFTSSVTPNQSPVITRPTSIAVVEDTATSLAGISFADADAGTGVLNVTLSVPGGSGTIAASASGGVSIVSGSGTATLQVSGTLANLNTWFASNASNPDYTPASNATGMVNLGILITDNGNSGSGGALTDNETSVLNISAVNDPPVNSLPSSFTVTEDTTTSLAGISVADVDAASASMSVNLAVPPGQGSFTASNAGGVTVSGSTSNSLTLNGTLSNINSYLGNVGNRPSYVPASNNTASVSLTVTSSDGGATGSGGTQSDIDVRLINFIAVNDGPTLTAPSTQIVAATGNTPIAGIVLGDVDSGNGNLDVVMSVNQGLLSSSNIDGITVVGGNNSATLTLLGTVTAFGNFFNNQRVNFNPNGAATTSTLTINCDDNGNTGAGSSIACPTRQISLTQGLFANGFE